MSIAKKYQFKPIIVGGSEAWQIADELKKANVPVVLKGVAAECPEETDPGELDPYDTPYVSPTLLKRAGVQFCFMSESMDTSMNLPYMVGRACAFGLSHDEAIRAITLDAATILGVGDRLGSLERGKIANVIVTDGDPLELTSQLRYLFIDGRPEKLESHYTDLYRKYMGRIK